MARRPLYRMPVAFGPSAGPRRGPSGEGFDEAESVRTLSCEVGFVTERSALEALLPAPFELRGDPVVSVVAAYLSDIAWLAGRGYNVLGVYIPATHVGKARTDGLFNAVLWENLTDPILTGRDELGIPKIYADIPPLDVHGANRYTARASWMGFEFVRLSIEGRRVVESDPQAALPILSYKYVPRTGAWGDADCEYATIVPAEDPSRRTIECWEATGTVSFFEATWNDMPTQFHIVNALASLPVLEVRAGRITSSIGGKDLSDTQVLP